MVNFNTKEKLEKLLKKESLLSKCGYKVNIKNTSKENMADILLKQINEYINIKNDEN